MDNANSNIGRPEHPGGFADDVGASAPRTPGAWYQPRGEQIRLWVVTLTPIITVVVTLLAR